MTRSHLLSVAFVLSGCIGSDPGTDPVETDVDTDTVGETDLPDTDHGDSDTEDTEVEPPDPCRLEPAVLEVGTGEDDFEPLTAGQELVMVHGPQGGWHLTGAVRLTNAPQLVKISYVVTDVESDTVVSDTQWNVALLPTVLGAWACEGSFVGMTGYLDVSALVDACYDSPPWLLGGHVLRVDYAVHDATDVLLAEGSQTVTAVPDATDPVRPDTCPDTADTDTP